MQAFPCAPGPRTPAPIASVHHRHVVNTSWRQSEGTVLGPGRFYHDNGLDGASRTAALAAKAEARYKAKMKRLNQKFSRDTAMIERTEQALLRRQNREMQRAVYVFSVVLIQAVWRGSHARHSVRRHKLRRHLAVWRVICWFYIKIVRFKRKVTITQNIVRMWASRGERVRRLNMRVVAFMLQRLWRGLKARRVAAKRAVIHNETVDFVETTILFASARSLEVILAPILAAHKIQLCWWRHRRWQQHDDLSHGGSRRSGNSSRPGQWGKRRSGSVRRTTSGRKKGKRFSVSGEYMKIAQGLAGDFSDEHFDTPSRSGSRRGSRANLGVSRNSSEASLDEGSQSPRTIASSRRRRRSTFGHDRDVGGSSELHTDGKGGDSKVVTAAKSGGAQNRRERSSTFGNDNPLVDDSDVLTRIDLRGAEVGAAVTPTTVAAAVADKSGMAAEGGRPRRRTFEQQLTLLSASGHDVSGLASKGETDAAVSPGGGPRRASTSKDLSRNDRLKKSAALLSSGSHSDSKRRHTNPDDLDSLAADPRALRAALKGLITLDGSDILSNSATPRGGLDERRITEGDEDMQTNFETTKYNVLPTLSSIVDLDLDAGPGEEDGLLANLEADSKFAGRGSREDASDEEEESSRSSRRRKCPPPLGEENLRPGLSPSGSFDELATSDRTSTSTSRRRASPGTSPRGSFAGTLDVPESPSGSPHAATRSLVEPTPPPGNGPRHRGGPRQGANLLLE